MSAPAQIEICRRLLDKQKRGIHDSGLYIAIVLLLQVPIHPGKILPLTGKEPFPQAVHPDFLSVAKIVEQFCVIRPSPLICRESDMAFFCFASTSVPRTENRRKTGITQIFREMMIAMIPASVSSCPTIFSAQSNR